MAEENKYCYFTIDDGTGVIRLKMFENLEHVNDIRESDKVLVIGFMKTYNDEVYVQPEFIKKLSSNEFYFHKIIREKLVKDSSILNNGEKFMESLAESEENNDEITLLIKLLKENDGMSFNELKEKLGVSEERIKEVLNTLMDLGDVFEPRKNFFKLV